MDRLGTWAGIAGIALLLAGCESALSRNYQPHDPRMVGTWKVQENDHSGRSFVELDRGEKSYFADGRACGFILTVDPDGKAEFSVFRSRWEVKDGKLYSTVLETNTPFLHPGEVIVDDIISVDGRTLVMRDARLSTGEPYTRYRSPLDQGDDLCKLADSVLHENMRD